MKTRKIKTFTLIEMLIVIVIIGILASALVPRLISVQERARDAKRSTDMVQIYNGLTIYFNDNGYSRRTSAYGESNAGGRDMSSQSGFLTFLVTAGILSSAPVDPTNNMTGYSNTGQYAYRYYCYFYSEGLGGTGAHLSYWKEGGTWKFTTGYQPNPAGTWVDVNIKQCN